MTPPDVITQATFSPVPLILILALGGWYLGWRRRLVARGEAWPAVRTASFCLAELSLAFGFVSGIAAYDRIFKVVAVQHILISIAAPIFLAVSAPITLALQAGSPRTRTIIERALHSRASRMLSHPKFTWTFYGLSLYVLYFTGLYAFALQHDPIHTLVHLGLLLAGCLFWWPAVGVDPVPYRPGQGARVFYMLLVLPLYTILGMGSGKPVESARARDVARGPACRRRRDVGGRGDQPAWSGPWCCSCCGCERTRKRPRNTTGSAGPRPPLSSPTGGRPGTPRLGLTRVDYPRRPAGGARAGHAGPPPYAGGPFRHPVAAGRPAGGAETRASAADGVVQDPGGLQPHRPAAAGRPGGGRLRRQPRPGGGAGRLPDRSGRDHLHAPRGVVAQGGGHQGLRRRGPPRGGDGGRLHWPGPSLRRRHRRRLRASLRRCRRHRRPGHHRPGAGRGGS